MPTVSIAVVLYEGFTALDAVGPYEVLSQGPGVDLRFVAERKGLVRTDTGHLSVQVDHDFDDVPRPDVLLVPGSTISFLREARNPAMLEYVRRAHEHTRHTVSICTGSLILAAAGILKDLEATSHWYPRQLLSAYGAKPVDRRIVDHGKIITAAGVSAGIDAGLHLMRNLWNDREARLAQLMIEYDPEPPFPDGGNAGTVDAGILRRAKRRLEWASVAWLRRHGESVVGSLWRYLELNLRSIF